MNFDIATEILAEEGIQTRTVRVTDNIASVQFKNYTLGQLTVPLIVVIKSVFQSITWEHFCTFIKKIRIILYRFYI